MVIISDENRQDVLCDYYLARYHACNRILKDNNIPTEIYNLRRIFQLIISKKDQPTEIERENFAKALNDLEKYIENYGKEIDLSQLSKEELNELFLDECYNPHSLTHKKVVEFFEHGADINYKDKNGIKAFYLASSSDDVDINREFLMRGADLNENLSTDSKNTIWLQNHSTNYEKLRLYIEYGANLNEISQGGDTVLHRLSDFINEKFHQNVRLLVESGADVNLKNKLGQTALFIAAKQGGVENIKYFKDKGCDIDLVDNQGNTPLLVAVKNKNKDSVEHLLKLGANKDIKDAQGKTAYELCIKCGYVDLAGLFDAEKAQNDYMNSEDYQKIKECKEKIINKLKNGSKQTTGDKEGHGELAYENEVYIFRYWEHQSDYSYETIYKTDEEVLKYLYNYYNYINRNKSELDGYEYVLSLIHP